MFTNRFILNSLKLLMIDLKSQNYFIWKKQDAT